MFTLERGGASSASRRSATTWNACPTIETVTPNAAWDNLCHSFARLSECHSRLRSAFATLDDATLGRFLGPELNSSHMREQIREHGDGYTMQLRVDTVDALREIDAVVLFAMTSPKLNRYSVFGGTPLHEIPYWREKRRLCPVVQVETQTYRLLFLSWQQNCSIHGKDDAHALRNWKLLNQDDKIRQLLEQEPLFASEYIKALGEWYHAIDRAFLLLHQRRVENLQHVLLHLVRSNRVVCVSTTLRVPKNYKIMDSLASAIRGRQRSVRDDGHGSMPVEKCGR